MKLSNYNTKARKVKAEYFITGFLFSLLFITLLRNRPPQAGGFIGNNPFARTVSGSASFSSGCPVCSSQGSLLSKGNLLKTGGLVTPDAVRPFILARNFQKEGGGSAANRTRPPQHYGWLDELIGKIHIVESGGRLNPPDGDDGRAVGALQIHKGAVDDVNRYYKTNFSYSDRSDFPKARLMARLYIQMWMEKHKREIAARIFNGGPRGWQKKSTDEYWEKVRAAK